MSFVGTRPEVVKYVKKYKPEYFATLLLPAGITSEASIKPLFEAGINLILSVALAKYTALGLTGIVIGTLVSNLFTNIWWEPYAFYVRCEYLWFKSFVGYDWMFTITVSKISEVQEDFEPCVIKSKGTIQQYPDWDEDDFDEE